MIMVMVTAGGTACEETALCAEHDTPESRSEVESQTIDKSPWGDPPIRGSWRDCTGNEALTCTVCGAAPGFDNRSRRG